MKKSLKSLLVLALFAVLLVGCSSKKEEDKAVDNGNAEKSITITGVNGEVTLDKPAKKGRCFGMDICGRFIGSRCSASRDGGYRRIS